jgi:putative hemolysin
VRASVAFGHAGPSSSAGIRWHEPIAPYDEDRSGSDAGTIDSRVDGRSQVIGRCVPLMALTFSIAACAAGASRSATASAPAATTSAAAASADQTAASYCTGKGGMLVTRVATWNTNGDPSTWLPLAGHEAFCEFDMGSGNTGTRISVGLTTLSSTEPTLAAVAYLSKVRTTSPPVVGQNPAEWSCANDYKGSASFGTANVGGGWVDASQPVFVIMNQCVFPDGSSIDEFGLWYHANGTVRGADLAPLFAYQPGDRLPAVYKRTVP